MCTDTSDCFDIELTEDDQELLSAIRDCKGLDDLAAIIGSDSKEEAYFSASRIWYRLREKEIPAIGNSIKGIPGDRININNSSWYIHGITHEDTPEEAQFLRKHVSRIINEGGVVYCEQGIRAMYFKEYSDVYATDDYSWARDKSKDLQPSGKHEDIVEELGELADQIRDTTFSLIDSGSHIYGTEFEQMLGDLVSDLFMGNEDFATGREFTSYQKTQTAAHNPARLVELQNYYKKRLLPQPIEREWLKKHDRELEIYTHARNERIADYVVYDHTGSNDVHVIVGAAHQPGVKYYLQKYRAGRRNVDDFEYYS